MVYEACSLMYWRHQDACWARTVFWPHSKRIGFEWRKCKPQPPDPLQAKLGAAAWREHRLRRRHRLRRLPESVRREWGVAGTQPAVYFPVVRAEHDGFSARMEASRR